MSALPEGVRLIDVVCQVPARARRQGSDVSTSSKFRQHGKAGAIRRHVVSALRCTKKARTVVISPGKARQAGGLAACGWVARHRSEFTSSALKRDFAPLGREAHVD